MYTRTCPGGQKTQILDENYLARVAMERSKYANALVLNDLPAIFHYWSNTYVRPKLEALGFSDDHAMFRRYMEEQCRRRGSALKRFVSIGSGNCDLEIELALHLEAKGHSDFVIDCIELNSQMLQRGARAPHERPWRKELRPGSIALTRI